MNTQELRLGNKVLYKGRIVTVDSITPEFVTIKEKEFHPGVLNMNEIEGIKLTDDLFNEIGAERDENDDVYIPVPDTVDYRYYIVSGFILLTRNYFSPQWRYRHIRHLHLFQNLYRDTTGEELKIDGLCH